MTMFDRLLIVVAALAGAQLVCCRADTTDNPLLSREDIARLSGIRVKARSESVKTRCALYASTLKDLVAAKLPETASETDIFEAVIDVLKQRKLPFQNPQPVLGDLQECVSAQGDSLGQQASQPRVEVIAGPPLKEGPAPKEEDFKQKMLDEHQTVKQRDTDRGQDIYYKPDKPEEDSDLNQNSNRAQPDGDHEDDGDQTHDDQDDRDDHDDHDDQGDEDEKHQDDENEDEDENNDDDDSEAEPEKEFYHADPDSGELKDAAHDAELIKELTSDKEQLEKTLEAKETELSSLKDEVARLKRITSTGRLAPAENQCELERARLEHMKQIYEAALKREETMKRIINESSKRSEKEDKKDDKERVKDPAEQAAILFDKLSAKDQQEDRCYKYYLLFSYPDKVVKKTIKTIAKLQVDLHDMGEFYGLVNPVFSYKLERILGDLSASKKKDARRAAKEFEQCFEAQESSGHQNQHDEQPYLAQQQQRPGVFEIPVEFYPPRRQAEDQQVHEDDSSVQIFPSAPGRFNGQGAAVAASAATATAYTSASGRGGSNFDHMSPIEPMMSNYNDYFFGRNPYIH